MQKSRLCDYIDAYILVMGTTTFAGVKANVVAQREDEKNRRVTCKGCEPFPNLTRLKKNNDIL